MIFAMCAFIFFVEMAIGGAIMGAMNAPTDLKTVITFFLVIAIAPIIIGVLIKLDKL
jgi:hypothetical protein